MAITGPKYLVSLSTSIMAGSWERAGPGRHNHFTNTPHRPRRFAGLWGREALIFSGNLGKIKGLRGRLWRGPDPCALSVHSPQRHQEHQGSTKSRRASLCFLGVLGVFV